MFTYALFWLVYSSSRNSVLSLMGKLEPSLRNQARVRLVKGLYSYFVCSCIYTIGILSTVLDILVPCVIVLQDDVAFAVILEMKMLLSNET